MGIWHHPRGRRESPSLAGMRPCGIHGQLSGHARRQFYREQALETNRHCSSPLCEKRSTISNEASPRTMFDVLFLQQLDRFRIELLLGLLVTVLE